jgi:hypothetical protein
VRKEKQTHRISRSRITVPLNILLHLSKHLQPLSLHFSTVPTYIPKASSARSREVTTARRTVKVGGGEAAVRAVRAAARTLVVSDADFEIRSECSLMGKSRDLHNHVSPSARRTKGSHFREPHLAMTQVLSPFLNELKLNRQTAQPRDFITQKFNQRDNFC